MTGLRAYHDRSPDATAAEQGQSIPDSTGPLADVTPMTELYDGTRPIRGQTVSAVADMTAADGTRLIAGLTWEIASGPETPVLRANAPPVLRLPERRARLTDFDRCGPAPASLLLAMAAGLTRGVPDASGAWAFLAELRTPEGDPAFWMALADLNAPDGGTAATSSRASGATPRPGPEEMFGDADEALTALQNHLVITEIAGIAVRWSPGEETRRDRMIEGFSHIGRDIPLHDVEPDATGLPVFVPPRQVPVKLLGSVGAGAGALLAGLFVVLPMVQAAFRAPPPPPPAMVSVGIAPGAFATSCTTALDAWWPRVVGWRLESTGCARAGYLPETPDLPRPETTDRLSAPMVIWRYLVPESGRNPVLARSAAGQVIATWPHEARIAETGLTLWQTASLPLVPVADTEEPAADAIRAHLAALWADAPDAVARTGDLFTITPSGSPPAATLFATASRVPGIAPVRLIQPGELVLAPITPRKMPITLFETTEGPSR